MTTHKEALTLALEALEIEQAALAYEHGKVEHIENAITAIKEALAQPEQEPVELSVNGTKINNIQVQSIKRVITRAKHAHMTDIKLRINGQDEWYEADWIKHITQTTELKCDGDFPEGFDSSFGLPAQALRTANAIMCDAIGTRKWDVPCTAKHLLTFAQLYTTPPQRKPLTDEAAMFAAQHMFLEWNRRQEDRLVKVAYEYGVFRKAIELYNEAAHGIKGDE